LANVSAPALTEAPEIAPPSDSGYNASERAVLEANVSKFQASNLKSLSAVTPLLPAALPGDGRGGTAGAPLPGWGTENGKGGAVPSFGDISPGFRPPEPAGLHGKLPEPILLQLPGDILFDFNASTLKLEADPLVKEALRQIQKYPRATIDIAGHTDTIGDDASNQLLSEARAQAVSARLKQGLNASAYTIRTRGFGRTRPIVNPTGNAEEQSRNRRVEIIIQALAE
jgi:outer membrane protein OmpA-like peptidoglycan-associated protein